MDYEDAWKINEYKDGTFEVLKSLGYGDYRSVRFERFESLEDAKNYIKSQTVKTTHKVDIKE